jgi:hypothetical protein
MTGPKTVSPPRFDRAAGSRHDGHVRRVLLLAIGLSALVWAVSARPATEASSHITGLSAGEACQISADSKRSSDSDRQWRAQQHTIAAVTESQWKSAPVHVALATASTRTFEPSQAASSPDPPARPVPSYLRHTPLLI